ncbi:MAG: cyclic nucleotide-binding domain-containing protein [bacterium]
MSEFKLLENTTLFAGLDKAQLERLQGIGQRHTYRDGDVIFEEGDSGHDVYVLLEGRIQITVKMSRDTEQAPVHTIVPGSVFGEFALVSDSERSATAQATKDSTCFVFTRESFEQLSEQDPHLGYRVTRNLAEILVGRIVKTTRDLRASLMF